MDIGFATINKKVDGTIINIIKNAFLKNKKLFNKTPKKFKIIICDNQEELKKNAKYYYQSWMTATVLRDSTLVTKSPDFIERKRKFKKKDFPSIINHEMNHVFWNDFYKATCKPCWLLEGFAVYAGGGFKSTKKELKEMIKKYDVDYSILQYRYLERNFKKGHIPIYPVWGEFTRFIAKKYGAKKIVKLLDEYSKTLKRKDYDKTFNYIFKKTEKELFGKFLEGLK